MSLQAELVAFADSVRVPTSAGEDHDTQRRMAIYRSLFYNNVEGFINTGFPVLRSLYEKSDWQSLIRLFFSEHSCSSPYFIDISKEFVEFLSNEYEVTAEDPIFLKELAHYEWLELALSVRQAEEPFCYWDQEAILPDLIMASPLTELAAYPFPVHQISKDFQPIQQSQMHYYMLYRDRDYNVQFQHLAPLSAMAVNLLQSNLSLSFAGLAEQVQSQVPHLNIESVAEGLRPLVTQWLMCGALVTHNECLDDQ